jgi:MOB kinase activator 1
MSVPLISVSSADETAPPPSSSSPSRKAHALAPSTSYNTVLVSYAPLSAPASYLSPAVCALKQGLCALTPPRNARTRAPFKPRSAAKGTTSYQLRQFAEATLGSGSLRKAVKLPEGEDVNEWLAVNGAPQFFVLFSLCANLGVLFAVVDFYNQINLLYGAITEFCSPQTCPEMKATDEYEVPVLDAGEIGADDWIGSSICGRIQSTISVPRRCLRPSILNTS